MFSQTFKITLWIYEKFATSHKSLILAGEMLFKHVASDDSGTCHPSYVGLFNLRASPSVEA